MKHLKEFNVFETEHPKGRVSMELQQKYPKLATSIKKELTYFFSRGLFGHFDIKETASGETILIYIPQDEKISPIEFNAFIIPVNLDPKKVTLKELEPTKSTDWESEDVESIKAFSKDINVDSWDKDYKTKITSLPLTSRKDSRWFSNSPQYSYFWDYLEMLLPMTKYTTPGEEEEVTLDQIKKTSEFRDLVNFGAYDDTSDRIWKNGNLRISHPDLAYSGVNWATGKKEGGMNSITIYSNGPIRSSSSGRPAIIGSAPGFKIINLDGWRRKIDWVKKYLMKIIAKDVFDIKSRKQQEELAKLPTNEYFNALLDIDNERFIDWLLSHGKEFVKAILDLGIDVKSYIEKDPAKAAVKLRKLYKHPVIKKAIDSLDSESTKDFSDSITLTGNLGELGF